MAQPCTRTPADEVCDALARLTDAESAIAHLRAHLEGLQRDPTYPRALQAGNCAGIVFEAICEATGHTHTAGDRLRIEFERAQQATAQVT